MYMYIKSNTCSLTKCVNKHRHYEAPLVCVLPCSTLDLLLQATNKHITSDTGSHVVIKQKVWSN